MLFNHLKEIQTQDAEAYFNRLASKHDPEEVVMVVYDPEGREIGRISPHLDALSPEQLTVVVVVNGRPDARMNGVTMDQFMDTLPRG